MMLSASTGYHLVVFDKGRWTRVYVRAGQPSEADMRKFASLRAVGDLQLGLRLLLAEWAQQPQEELKLEWQRSADDSPETYVVEAVGDEAFDLIHAFHYFQGNSSRLVRQGTLDAVFERLLKEQNLRQKSLAADSSVLLGF